MDIIQYLGANDLKSLRLAGNKSTCLSDPRLTAHLPLRMDSAPFFRDNRDRFSEEYVARWLDGRSRLVIKDPHAPIGAARVAYLVANGFLDSVSEIVVHDCHRHRSIVEILSNLANVRSLSLIELGAEEEGSVEDLEAVVKAAGRMSSLESLSVEFDAVVHGSRLAFLAGLSRLRDLRLVGFDLSEGLGFVGGLSSLETLHLCHGNFYSSPSDDVDERDLADLVGLVNLTRLHLEGFDCLTDVGLRPFGARGNVREVVLKHCQEMEDGCLSPIGTMTGLRSLHFVTSSCDDAEPFEREGLKSLNALSELERLSLFYVVEDPSDLGVLAGLTSLETLNVAFEEPQGEKEAGDLLSVAVETFPSLRRLRIFSEDGMECCFSRGGLEVEYATFNFGDVVYLE